MGNTNTELGAIPFHVAITIPSNAGTGDTIRNLVSTAGFALPEQCSIIVSAKAPGVDPNTARAAFVVAGPVPGSTISASDFTARGQPVAEDADYYLPSQRSADLYVRSTTGSTVSALVIVLL